MDSESRQGDLFALSSSRGGEQRKAKVIHVVYSPEEEGYVYPDSEVIDEEDRTFSVGDVGFQTILSLNVGDLVYRAGKEWCLVKQKRGELKGEFVRTVRLKSYCTRVCNISGVILEEERFDSLRDMLFAFAARYDPGGDLITAHCAICNLPLEDFFSDYPNPVCDDCDQRAVNIDGEKPKFYSSWDDGDNPIFIDERKCWRRYRFGSIIVTMLDRHDSQDLSEFYEKSKTATRQ